MTNTDEQRAAFEAWVLKYVPDSHLKRCPDDRYIMYYIDRQWLAWQAAIEHARLNPQADTQLATTHVPAP